MNRRNFLCALVPTIVAPAAVVELLIPKRTIFLPPRGGWLNVTGYANAGVPAFFLAYVDPKLIQILLTRDINETDAQFRRRFLSLASANGVPSLS